MLSLQDKETILNETPLFAGCVTGSLAAIAEIARERHCGKGEAIYEAGSEAVDVFVLVRGLVSFTTDSGVGTAFVETLMKRHMVFGWAALIPDHTRRLGGAKCLEETTLLAINGDALMDVLGRHPQTGFTVMRRLTSMIANTFIDKRT